MMNRNTARTISAMTAGSTSASSFRDERRGAPDLDDLHPLAGLDHLIVIVGARGPDLAADPHAAETLVVGDPLDDHRAAAHERRRAGPQQRWLPAVRAGEAAARGEGGGGDTHGDGP